MDIINNSSYLRSKALSSSSECWKNILIYIFNMFNSDNRTTSKGKPILPLYYENNYYDNIIDDNVSSSSSDPCLFPPPPSP